MLLAEKLERQLKHLDDIITNQKFWYSNRFRLMNNEAGAGKSRQTIKSIAKLASETNKTIVYVQMFANEDSKKQDGKLLKATVEEINKHVNKNVAAYLCNENRKEHRKILLEKQVICITHKKYLELCREGKKSNFVTNAHVLIIDEFPNLFESFLVSELDVMKFQGFTLLSEKEKLDIEEMNNFLVSKLNELREKYGKSEMRIINLQKLDVKRYIKVLKTIIKNAKKDNKIAHAKTIETANKVLEIFTHSSVYAIEKIGNKKYPVLYSFYKDIDYILSFENNIILDANGSFDMRYKLREDLFKLDPQSKVFDYKDSKINMYLINTSKTALSNYKNILDDVYDYINKNNPTKGFYEQKKYLIVTDVATESYLTELQKERYRIIEGIHVAHFGALVGKNDFRDCDNAYIIKTPFFSWVQYILQYLFYSKKDLNGNTNCKIKQVKGEYGNYSVFRNTKFNNLKNSIVLGEYYQACKRIARDGRDCTFNILMLDESIFTDLVAQFKNIKKDIKDDLIIQKKEMKEKKPKNNERLEIIKKCLLDAKKSGKNKILKQEVCDYAGLRKDKLSKHLKSIQKWMDANNIKSGEGKERSYILVA